jgi:hypothetical protein
MDREVNLHRRRRPFNHPTINQLKLSDIVVTTAKIEMHEQIFDGIVI